MKNFQELSKMILKSKREARNEKDLYQKMLGQAQKLEQKSKQQKTTTTEESKVTTLHVPLHLNPTLTERHSIPVQIVGLLDGNHPYWSRWNCNVPL